MIDSMSMHNILQSETQLKLQKPSLITKQFNIQIISQFKYLTPIINKLNIKLNINQS